MPKATRPKLSPEEQHARFIEAARQVGASEDERDFDAAVKRVAKAPPIEGGSTVPASNKKRSHPA